jgi:outer membrane autotransporter protein
VTLGAGSKLIGTLSLGGGGGADAISFIGGNHNLTFETGNLTSAVLTGSTIPYAVSGDRAAALDPTSFAANTTMLQSTTRVISSLAPDFTPARNGAKALPVLSYAPGPAALKLPEGAMAHVADAPLKSQTMVSADGTGIWTRVFGGQSYDKAEGILVGFRNSYYGGAMGIDRPVDANLRYGAFLGGLSSTSKLALNYGDTDSRMGFLGAYARYAFGASFVKVGLQAGYGSNDTTRRTNNNLLASGIETATSNSSTWYVSPELSFGHEFALGRFLNGDVSVTPTGQLRYLFGSVSSYSETGGTDNLRMDGHAAQSVEERLTFKLSHVSTLTSDYQLKLDVIGGVLGTQRVSGDTLTGNLLGQSIRFSEPGKANRKAATAGLGAEVSRGLASFFVAGEYIAQQNGVFDYSGRVGANIRF